MDTDLPSGWVRLLDYGLSFTMLIVFLWYSMRGRLRWEREVLEKDKSITECKAENAQLRLEHDRMRDIIKANTTTTSDAVLATAKAVEALERARVQVLEQERDRLLQQQERRGK